MKDERKYLSTREAAHYLGLSARTLNRYRVSGDGPVFHRFGGRVRYPRARGDRAGPSQPKSQGQGRRPGCDLRGRRRRAQDAGSRWPKTVPAPWKPCGCCEQRERRQSSAAARPCSNSTTPSLPHRRKCVTRSATSPACSACVPVRPGGRTRSAIETRWSRPSSPLKSLARRILDINDEIAELDRFIVPLVEGLAPVCLSSKAWAPRTQAQ